MCSPVTTLHGIQKIPPDPYPCEVIARDPFFPDESFTVLVGLANRQPDTKNQQEVREILTKVVFRG